MYILSSILEGLTALGKESPSALVFWLHSPLSVVFFCGYLTGNSYIPRLHRDISTGLFAYLDCTGIPAYDIPS